MGFLRRRQVTIRSTAADIKEYRPSGAASKASGDVPAPAKDAAPAVKDAPAKDVAVAAPAAEAAALAS